jgi:oligopeptide transport system substrate-binding protein
LPCLRACLLSSLCLLIACGRPDPGDEVVRVALAGQPTTLDPNKAYDALAGTVLMQLHEGLTRHDAQLNVSPALASSWTFNSDFTEITFHLRDDIKWSDGQPITADHFVYSWRRLLDPATAAEYAYFMYDIVGAQDFNEGKGSADQLGVKALTAKTLHIKLNRPAPYFPHITAFMVTYPLRKDIIKKYGDTWTRPEHIVSSGPFILTDVVQDYRLTLAPNPHYSLNKVNIKRLEIYPITERATALHLFMTGHMDVVPDLLPMAIPAMCDRAGYIHAPKLEVRYVGFRQDRGVLKDVRVRQALTLALDRGAFGRVLRGGELETTTWVPPGMFGHMPDVGLGRDVERARALLAQAGYPEGRGFPKLTLMLRAGDDWRLMAESIQEQWRAALGVEVVLEVREPKVFFREIDSDAPPPMHLARWIADFPDPENFMSLFASTSGNNELGFMNKEYDQLVDAAVRTADREVRLRLYQEAQELLLVKQAAIAPLYVAGQNMLIRPGLKGVVVNAMGDVYLGQAGWEAERTR